MTVPSFPRSAWHAATPRFGRRLGRALLRDLLLLVLLLPLVELGLRLGAPGLRAWLYTDGLTGGHVKRSNAYGLREREFPREKPEGQRRVLCVGDSTTYGSGVAEEDTYPRALERRFPADAGVFVINAGGEGSSLGKAAAFLERDGLSFAPDVVVVGFSPTLVSVTAERGELAPAEAGAAKIAEAPPAPPPVPRRLSPRTLLLPLHGLLAGTYTYVAWDGWVRKGLYRLGVLQDRVDKQRGGILAYAFDVPGADGERVARAYATVAAQLRALDARLRALGVPLVVVTLPYRFELSDDRRDNERGFPLRRIRIRPAERLRAELRDSGIPIVDPLPALRALRADMLAGRRPYRPLFLHNDYGHLDAEGNRVVAERLHGPLTRALSLARAAGSPDAREGGGHPDVVETPAISP